jgi:hypothetical protein
VAVHAHENVLARARARQTDPDWRADYRATRPKVERKLGHLMRRATATAEPESAASSDSTPTSAC